MENPKDQPGIDLSRRRVLLLLCEPPVINLNLVMLCPAFSSISLLSASFIRIPHEEVPFGSECVSGAGAGSNFENELAETVRSKAISLCYLHSHAIFLCSIHFVDSQNASTAAPSCEFEWHLEIRSR